jgi:hypothetical protein
MNPHEVLDTARLAGEWFFDRRERLELHDNERIALLWLAVREIQALVDGLHALDDIGLLTVEDRVLRDDLTDLIDGRYLDLEDA